MNTLYNTKTPLKHLSRRGIAAALQVYNLTAEGEPEEDTTYVRKVDLKNLQGFKKKVAFPLQDAGIGGNVGASIFYVVPKRP